MKSYGTASWLDYYDTDAIMSAWYYTSRWILYITLHTNLKASCQMHFIARSQVRSEVHSWFHSIAQSQPALPCAPNCSRWHTPGLLDCTLSSMLSRRSQAYSRARSQIHSQLHSMTLPACLTLRSPVSSQYALNHTPEHAPKYTHNCTWWHAPSLLDNTLPSKLSRHSQEHLRVRTQVHLRVARKYTLHCTRWHTPSLLGSMLPNTLSRGKTLPISIHYMLPCMLLCARSRDLLSCRRQAPGGVKLVAGGGWAAAYVGRNHDVGQYHSLNLIFSVASVKESHHASRSWCWQLKALILQER